MRNLILLFPLLAAASGCGVSLAVPGSSGDSFARPIYGISESDDGRILAGYGMGPDLWFQTAGSQRTVAHNGNARTLAVAFRPGTHVLLACCDDGALLLWEKVGNRLQHRRVARLEAQANCCAFSRDGRSAVTGCADGSVQVWDVERNWLRRRSLQLGEWVWSVAFSPDGGAVAACGDNGALRVWNLNEKHGAIRLAGHRGTVADLAFAPDGRRLVTGGHDFTVRLWDLNRRRVVWRAEMDAEVSDVCISPDGALLAANCPTRSVMIWDLPGRRLVHREPGCASDIAFLGDGRTLLTAGYDGGIYHTPLHVHRSVRGLRGGPTEPASESPASTESRRTSCRGGCGRGRPETGTATAPGRLRAVRRSRPATVPRD